VWPILRVAATMYAVGAAENSGFAERRLFANGCVSPQGRIGIGRRHGKQEAAAMQSCWPRKLQTPVQHPSPATFGRLLPDELIGRIATFVSLHDALILRATSTRIRVAASAATRQGGSVLVVCGGCHGLQTLSFAEKLDPQIGSWEQLPDMDEPRRCAVAVVRGSRMYVIGGSNGSCALASVERFNVELGCWERLQDMPDCRVWACAGNIGGTLYVCAGTDGLSSPHSYVRSMHSFQEDLGVWQTLPPMLHGRRCAVSAVLLGCLYVCGGSNGKLPLRSVERFDPRCKQLSKWTEVAPMPSGRRHATCFVAGEATLFVLGGQDASHCTSSGLAFDARAGSWTTLQPQIALGRWWATSAVVAGQPYICGGYGRVFRIGISGEVCRGRPTMGATSIAASGPMWGCVQCSHLP